MKFPKIQSHVPQGEHFDESAIVNEGGYLSVNHLTAIEDVLASHETELSTITQNLQTANASVTSLTTERDNANTALETANKTVTAQATKITNLEAQIAAFGKQESGNGSVLPITGDKPIETGATPSYLSENNPANQFFDQRVKAKK